MYMDIFVPLEATPIYAVNKYFIVVMPSDVELYDTPPENTNN